MLGEKARQEQDKNTTSCFEQIEEAAPHKTTTVKPLTSDLTNYPSRINKTCRTLLKK